MACGLGRRTINHVAMEKTAYPKREINMSLGIRKLRAGKLLIWPRRQHRPDDTLSEDDLVTLLATDMPLMGHFLLSTFCTFFRQRNPGDGVYLSLQVPITALGLPAVSRPGDIDLLIIPHKQGIPQPLETIAVESKVCRPTQSRPGKSPNSCGLAQSNALIGIGFAWVALLHFIQSEPSPPSRYVDGEMARIIDNYGRAEMLGPKYDLFPLCFCR
jgi:hypothetical protein